MRIKTCLALALAGALSVSAAFATTLDKAMSLKTLAQQATVAVVGKATDSRTLDTDNGIVTITTFVVSGKLWGLAEEQSTVEVVTPGGTFKPTKFRVGEQVAGAPILMKGSEHILLLKTNVETGKLEFVGFNQGDLQIAKTDVGAAVVLPGSATHFPLQEAMAAIMRAKADTSDDVAN